MPQGRFITFEGGEGCGKTTQLKYLGDYLQAQGINVLLTKEPGGTEVGIELRKILCSGDVDKLDPIAEALLYYADRRLHMQQKILPALAQGTWVLSDRFADSTLAYQYYGYDKKISKEILKQLYTIVVGDFCPDLTIILDINPIVGLSRSIQRNKIMAAKEVRFENKELNFHRNLRSGFLEIAQTSSRYVVLDAQKSIEELHQDIIKTVKERLINK